MGAQLVGHSRGHGNVTGTRGCAEVASRGGWHGGVLLKIRLERDSIPDKPCRGCVGVAPSRGGGAGEATSTCGKLGEAADVFPTGERAAVALAAIGRMAGAAGGAQPGARMKVYLANVAALQWHRGGGENGGMEWLRCSGIAGG